MFPFVAKITALTFGSIQHNNSFNYIRNDINLIGSCIYSFRSMLILPNLTFCTLCIVKICTIFDISLHNRCRICSSQWRHQKVVPGFSVRFCYITFIYIFNRSKKNSTFQIIFRHLVLSVATAKYPPISM